MLPKSASGFENPFWFEAVERTSQSFHSLPVSCFQLLPVAGLLY